MSSQHFIVAGAVLFVASLWVARHYLKAGVIPTRAGLTLGARMANLGRDPVSAPPDEHSRRIGLAYRCLSLCGFLLVVYGFSRRGSDPVVPVPVAPVSLPMVAPGTIPVLFRPAPATTDPAATEPAPSNH